MIITVAGNGINGYSGDGGIATAAEIEGGPIGFDKVGNFYIADLGAGRVRMVNPEGIIQTIAGNGAGGFNGDNISPLLASIPGPSGIAINDSGDIYVSSTPNNRIRLITKHPNQINYVEKKENGVQLYPNPSPGSFNLKVNTEINEVARVNIINVLGAHARTFSITTNHLQQITLNVPPGTYYLTATTDQHTYSQQIIVQ